MKKIFLVVFFFFFFEANAQWITYTLPYSGSPYSLCFYNLNVGISGGYESFQFNGQIYYTTNSGLNWLISSYPVQLRILTNIQFINSTLVYASGAENYTFAASRKENGSIASFPYFYRQKLINSGKFESAGGYKAAFLKSTNSGLSWTRAGNFDTLTRYMLDIRFFDANSGYALIDSGLYNYTCFFKTTNGGVNWQFVSNFSDPFSEKEEMIFLNMNTGYVQGFNYGGRIYKTTNAGVNWTITIMPTQIDAITFFDVNTGLAIGITETGVSCIYKTSNGGSQWNIVQSGLTRRQYSKLRSITSSGVAFATGHYVYDTILTKTKLSTLKTTDYGANWVLKDFSPDVTGVGLSLIDVNNFFMSGADFFHPAKILKSTNGGSVFVSQTGTELPSSFKLYPNYPNPFNPSTRINFDISKQGFVKISVFNLLGREVSVPVNEYLNTGSYTTGWDASVHPSGVYFYKLESGNYSETKKMLLLK